MKLNADLLTKTFLDTASYQWRRPWLLNVCFKIASHTSIIVCNDEYETGLSESLGMLEQDSIMLVID